MTHNQKETKRMITLCSTQRKANKIRQSLVRTRGTARATWQVVCAVAFGLCGTGCESFFHREGNFVTLSIDVPREAGCASDTGGKVLITAPPFGSSTKPVNVTCSYGDKCSVKLLRGIRVQIEATKAPGERQQFLGFSGDCAGSPPICNLTMGSSKHVTAKFCASSR
jgi:hypothetical protein